MARTNIILQLLEYLTVLVARHGHPFVRADRTTRGARDITIDNLLTTLRQYP